MAKKRFHRAKSGIKSAARGGKATAVGAAAGAASAYGIGQASAHVAFIRDNWYAPPLTLLALGHFLKRKHPNIGSSIIGAAGAIGYYSYALTHGGAKGLNAAGPDAGAFEAGSAEAGYMGAPDANSGTSQNSAMLGTGGNASGWGDYQPEVNEAMGLQG